MQSRLSEPEDEDIRLLYNNIVAFLKVNKKTVHLLNSDKIAEIASQSTEHDNIIKVLHTKGEDLCSSMERIYRNEGSKEAVYLQYILPHVQAYMINKERAMKLCSKKPYLEQQRTTENKSKDCNNSSILTTGECTSVLSTKASSISGSDVVTLTSARSIESLSGTPLSTLAKPSHPVTSGSAAGHSKVIQPGNAGIVNGPAGAMNPFISNSHSLIRATQSQAQSTMNPATTNQHASQHPPYIKTTQAMEPLPLYANPNPATNIRSVQSPLQTDPNQVSVARPVLFPVQTNPNQVSVARPVQSPFPNQVSIARPVQSPFPNQVSIARPVQSPFPNQVSIARPVQSPFPNQVSIARPVQSPFPNQVSLARPVQSPFPNQVSVARPVHVQSPFPNQVSIARPVQSPFPNQVSVARPVQSPFPNQVSIARPVLFSVQTNPNASITRPVQLQGIMHATTGNVQSQSAFRVIPRSIAGENGNKLTPMLPIPIQAASSVPNEMGKLATGNHLPRIIMPNSIDKSFSAREVPLLGSVQQAVAAYGIQPSVSGTQQQICSAGRVAGVMPQRLPSEVTSRNLLGQVLWNVNELQRMTNLSKTTSSSLFSKDRPQSLTRKPLPQVLANNTRTQTSQNNNKVHVQVVPSTVPYKLGGLNTSSPNPTVVTSPDRLVGESTTNVASGVANTSTQVCPSPQVTVDSSCVSLAHLPPLSSKSPACGSRSSPPVTSVQQLTSTSTVVTVEMSTSKRCLPSDTYGLQTKEIPLVHSSDSDTTLTQLKQMDNTEPSEKGLGCTNVDTNNPVKTPTNEENPTEQQWSSLLVNTKELLHNVEAMNQPTPNLPVTTDESRQQDFMPSSKMEAPPPAPTPSQAPTSSIPVYTVPTSAIVTMDTSPISITASERIIASSTEESIPTSTIMTLASILKSSTMINTAEQQAPESSNPGSQNPLQRLKEVPAPSALANTRSSQSFNGVAFPMVKLCEEILPLLKGEANVASQAFKSLREKYVLFHAKGSPYNTSLSGSMGGPSRSVKPSKTLRPRSPHVLQLVLVKLDVGEEARWKQGKVKSKRQHPKRKTTLYEVKCDGKHYTKELHHLAQVKTVEINEVNIKDRVVAWYGDFGYLFSGVVMEKPSKENGNRILIFFDDGFAQYLLPKSVHFVYEKSVTFDACYADMKLFLKEYFKIYPKRLMVRLKMGDHLKVERFGKLVAATVVQVDCSLVKLKLDDRKVPYEWLYRGNIRLEPIFQEIKRNQKALWLHASSPTSSEFTFTETTFDPECPPADTPSDNSGITLAPRSDSLSVFSKESSTPYKLRLEEESSTVRSARPTNKPLVDKTASGKVQTPRFSIESQGFTEDQDKEKTKTPRITEEWWNSQKRLSDPVEKKMKEGRKDSRIFIQSSLQVSKSKGTAVGQPVNRKRRHSDKSENGTSSGKVSKQARPVSSFNDIDCNDSIADNMVLSAASSDKTVDPPRDLPSALPRKRPASTASEPTAVSSRSSRSSLCSDSEDENEDDSSSSAGSEDVEFGHNCGEQCKGSYDLPDDYLLYHSLAVPLMLGWSRDTQVVYKRKSRRSLGHVYYIAPCRIRLRTHSEVLSYLMVTKEDRLTPEVFCFSSSVKINLHLPERPESALYYTKDISGGLEKVPISCVNEIDSDPIPEIEYITSRRPEKEVVIDTSPSFLPCCTCKDNCADKSVCQCVKLSRDELFRNRANDLINPLKKSEVGYVNRRLSEYKTAAIFECNSGCPCKAQCSNKVLQSVAMPRLQVFKTANRGWGVRCIDDLPKGTFVAHYCGVVLTDKQAEERAMQYTDAYLVDLDYVEVMETHKEIIESDNEGSQTSCLDVVQYLLDSSPTSSDHDGPWENPSVETQDSDEQSDINLKKERPLTREQIRERQSSTTSSAETNHPEKVITPLKVAVAPPTPKDGGSQMSNDEEDADLPSFDLTAGKFGSLTPKKIKEEIKEVSPTKVASPQVKVDHSGLTPHRTRCRRGTGSRLRQGFTKEDAITFSDSDTEVPLPVSFGKERKNSASSSLTSNNTSETTSVANNGTPMSFSGDHSHQRELIGDRQVYVMDAAQTGNVARFFNHSCLPNMFVQNVFVDTHDLRFPWVALFTKTTVKAMTELTWDYNYVPGMVEDRELECKCGAPNCRGRLL